ncbi:unnamed protein product, partial [Allacma fusca]
LRIWSGSSLLGNLTVNGSTVSSVLTNLSPGQSYSLQVGSFTAKGVGMFSSMRTFHFRPETSNANGNNHGSNSAKTDQNPHNTYKGKSSNRGKSQSNKGKITYDGNNINFGSSHEESERESGEEMSEGYEDRDSSSDGIATFGGTAANNDFLTEAWFVALIGSVIFVLLLVFVFALYMRRCQLRKNSDKLKGKFWAFFLTF